MSIFEVQILQPSGTILEVETISGSNSSNIEIVQTGSTTIEIIEDVVVLPSDFNTFVDAEIAEFISAGSGIVINTAPTGMTISSPLMAGSGISLGYQSGIYTISANQDHLNPENVQDIVGVFIKAGNYISINYEDGEDSLTVSATGLQPSGNYSLVGHSHQIADVSGLQLALDSKQPSGSYASAIHSHVVSDITNFASGVIAEVSGVYAPLNSPAFTGTPTTSTPPSGTNSSQIANTAFVRTEISNLVNSAPSTLDTLNELATALGNDPNFATTVASGLGQKADLSGASFTGPVSGPSGNFGLLQQSGVNVSVSGHQHSYTDIVNFASGIEQEVSTLLVAGSYININYDSLNDTVAISATGVQPSGNYSVVGHTHTSSQITDFNSGVSGLLPVKNIVAGTGIDITSSSGTYTINSTVSGVAEAASLITNVFNKTGSPIPKMSVVYINGGQGDQPTIALASSSGEITSSKTYGITYENINNMSAGKVIVAGALTGVNTDQWNPTAPTGNINGTTLWLGNTPGTLTTTKPYAPNHMVSVGTVVRTHQNEGVIEVRIQNGFELEELHNVAITGVTNGQFLQYNASSQLWVPTSSGNFTSLSVNNTGVSVSGHTHTSSNISDFNSSVSGLLPVTNIVGGTNISVISSGTSYTVSVSGQLGLTSEEVDDRVASLLTAGSGISIDYNDSGNLLTISNTSISPDEIEEYAATSNFPASGNLNILYVATDSGQLFKWDGEVYYEAGPQGASTGSHGIQHKTDNADPIPLAEYTVPQLTSNTNNLAHNNKDILYLHADANNRELSGLIAPSFCCVKLLVNLSSTNTIILDNQSTNSDPANRFLIYTGADYYLLPGYSVSLLYDTNASRWRVL